MGLATTGRVPACPGERYRFAMQAHRALPDPRDSRRPGRLLLAVLAARAGVRRGLRARRLRRRCRGGRRDDRCPPTLLALHLGPTPRVEKNGIVFSNDAPRADPDVRVGDTIALTFDGATVERAMPGGADSKAQVGTWQIQVSAIFLHDSQPVGSTQVFTGPWNDADDW